MYLFTPCNKYAKFISWLLIKLQYTQFCISEPQKSSPEEPIMHQTLGSQGFAPQPTGELTELPRPTSWWVGLTAPLQELYIPLRLYNEYDHSKDEKDGRVSQN